jgi:putative copper resistance protein D
VLDDCLVMERDRPTPGTAGRRFPRGLIVAVAVLLAAGTVVAVAGLAGIGPYRALGNGDPGALVRYGAPLVRLAVDAAATVCIGFLVAAVLFSGRPQASGVITPIGYARLRVAGRWAVAWLLAVVVLIPLDAADTGGIPLARALAPRSWIPLLSALEAPKAWLGVAVLAGLVAIGCRLALRWTTVLVLAALAVAALLPPLVTAHVSSDTGHDVSTSALLLHVPAAVVWLGTLVALAWRSGGWSPTVADRYRRLATWCWLVLAASGLVDAFYLVPVDGLASGYGLLLAVKVLLVGGLGWLGWWLRGRATAERLHGRAVTRPNSWAAVPRPNGRAAVTPLNGRAAVTRLKGRAAVTRLNGPGAPERLRGRDGAGRIRRLAVVDVLVLAATFGASVGLTHLAPPGLVGRPVSADQTLLGYDLPGPPTLLRLAFDWRLDPIFLALVVLLSAGYLVGLRHLRFRRRSWPASRSAAWFGGCAVLLVATCSGVGRYAAAMFSVHLAAHMLVGMVAPVLLALGAPVGLAASVLPRTGGPWRCLRALRDSSGLRWASHPAVAATLFAAAPFLLYFTDLFDLAARFHWAHVGANLAFLALGYLFAWVAVGPDPLPREVPQLARLGMLLAAMPFDVLFGALVIGSHRILGNGAAGANMYSALGLPWVPSLAADQRLAGALALVLGELALLIALVAVVVGWRRAEHRDDTGYEQLLAALRSAGRGAPVGPVGPVEAALRSAGRGAPVGPVEAAQPQAVGHHQQRGQRHRPAGDQRVEQSRGGDR